ncbi:hypothetical protein B0H14DRAFT_3482816 [Mycena olivaceomarginata]|nr:hypothetical protein B0H14DRAFT_3482816 [Mycena olivaceomarginata]
MPCAAARTSRRASSSTFKMAGPEERARIINAIRARRGELMMHLCVLFVSPSFPCVMLIIPPRYARFGHWAIQRCLQAVTGPKESACGMIAFLSIRKCDWLTECDWLPNGFDGNEIGTRCADVSATDAN